MRLSELEFEKSVHGPYHTASDDCRGLWIVVDGKHRYQLLCPVCGSGAVKRENWYAAKEVDQDLIDSCENGHVFLEEEGEIVEAERIPGEDEGLTARVLGKKG